MFLTLVPIQLCHKQAHYILVQNIRLTWHGCSADIYHISVGKFFSFCISLEMCMSHFSMLSIYKPKNFVDSHLGISVSPSLILKSVISSRFLVNTRNTLFDTFSVSLFALNQSCIIHRSCSMQYFKYHLLWWPSIKVVSSANYRHSIYSKYI